MDYKTEIPYYLLKMGLGSLATKVAGMGIDWMLNTKHSNMNLSSRGDSGGNDPSDPNFSMNDPTSNATNSSPNITDPYYQPNSRHDSQNSNQNSASTSGLSTSGWTASDILKTLGYAASLGVPTLQLLNSMLGGGKGGSSNVKNTTNTTVKPNIKTTIDPKIDVDTDVDVDVDNEVDYTPSSFHNFVPTINIHPSDYHRGNTIEINPKVGGFIPYEPGYKSKPRQHINHQNDRLSVQEPVQEPVYISTDWLFKPHLSNGFSNI